LSDDGLRQPKEWQNWWNGIHPVPRVQNPRHAALLSILYKRPGLNIRELAEMLSVTRTAAKYHLRRLERSNLVVKVRRGHHQLFFPFDMSERRRDAIVLLRIGAVRLVAQELFEHPREDWTQIGERVQISTRQVRRIVRQLRKARLIEVAPGGGISAHNVHMHPELRLLLAHAAGRLNPEDAQPRQMAPAWLPGSLMGAAQHLSYLR
jgi:DNA-binding MarR family transcriptional regulator